MLLLNVKEDQLLYWLGLKTIPQTLSARKLVLLPANWFSVLHSLAGTLIVWLVVRIDGKISD